MRTITQDAVLNICREAALVEASISRLGTVVSERQNWIVLGSITKPSWRLANFGALRQYAWLCCLLQGRPEPTLCQ